MLFIQYVLAACGSAVAIAFASIAWPLLTVQPRPEPLTKVRDVVIQTPLGAHVAQVLGASDESNVQPVNVGTFVAEQANAVVHAVAMNVKNTATNHMLLVLAKKFQELPSDQQLQFQSMICEPSSVPELQQP